MCIPEQQLIAPFEPRPFPPQRIHLASIEKLLLKAKHCLNDYDALLQSSPLPKLLFPSFAAVEAIHSLHSQKIEFSSLEFFKKERLTKRGQTLVLDYVKALHWGIRQCTSHAFSKKQICTLHRISKRVGTPRLDLGRYRNRQNWIGPSASKREEAYFLPPRHQVVPTLMQELFTYMNSPHKEPLFQLALSFAQLQIIHPFMDGNGRIARLFIPLFLYKKRALSFPLFFMSNYFTINRLKYFESLFKTTEESSWRDWLAFFLKGIISESRKYKKAVAQLISLYEKIIRSHPRLKKQTIEFLFQNPFFTTAAFSKAKGNASVLEELIKQRILRKVGPGKFSVAPLISAIRKL